MHTNGRKEKPIIFSGPMVRAILEGRKTQTRRVVKPQPRSGRFSYLMHANEGVARLVAPDYSDSAKDDVRCPYGYVGDCLWVRESAYIAPPNFSDADALDAKHWDYNGVPRIVGYAASMSSESVRCATDYGVKKTPSIHVPRWASRITLEITDVRVERLQEISEVDQIAEGAQRFCPAHPECTSFAIGWDALNAKRGYSWKSNPWVWVISFRREQEATT